MTIKSDGVIADPVKTEGVVAYGVGQGTAAGGGGVTTLIYDSFTDTPGVLLPVHAIDETGAGVGTSWTVFGAGTWRINTGVDPGTAAETTTSSANGAFVDVGKSEHVTYTTGMKILYGLVTRYVDSLNYFLIYYGSGDCLIYEVSAGSYILRASGGASWGTAASVETTVVTTSSGISVTATDGTTTVTPSYVSTTHNTGTGVGISQSGTPSTARFIKDIRCIDSTDPADLP